MRTGGEVSDYKAVPQLLAIPVTRPRKMLADKGYDADAVHGGKLDQTARARHRARQIAPVPKITFSDTFPQKQVSILGPVR
ncbi:hypothetical protein [Rhizobium indicum]|uniref:hypothetical protein n=1 Tax=Rhizobium sp. WYCCWR 11128 TaxID=2749832 RepID=UPI001FED0DB7|nr:hypothetical protein [Rhizobium indicum]